MCSNCPDLLAFSSREVAVIEDDRLAGCQAVGNASVRFIVGAPPLVGRNGRAVESETALVVDCIEAHDHRAGAADKPRSCLPAAAIRAGIRRATRMVITTLR